MNNKGNGFVKSEFDENTVVVKKLGKFGGAQKREPSESLTSEYRQAKKIAQDSKDLDVENPLNEENKESSQ